MSDCSFDSITAYRYLVVLDLAVEYLYGLVSNSYRYSKALTVTVNVYRRTHDADITRARLVKKKDTTN